MTRWATLVLLALLVIGWSHGGGPGALQPPANTSIPVLSGTLTVGQAVSSTTGSWNNCVPPCTYQYTFYHEGAIVSGPSSTNSYTLASGDLSDRISVSVVATNTAGASSPALSLVSNPVISTTAFYVSSSGGSDANAGTSPGAAWKTLAKVGAYSASPGFAAGTSILFNRGDTWDWTSDSAGPVIFFSSSGSSGNPIVLDAYGAGANPIIDGSITGFPTNSSTDWTNPTGNVWVSHAQFFPPLSQTANISNASPCVVTMTGGSASPTRNDQPVVFGGTVPTGITAGQVYYTAALSGNTFEISSTVGGGNLVGTTSSSSGTTVGISGLPYFGANDVGNILWGFSALGGTAPAQVMTASVGTMTGGGLNNVWYRPGDGTNGLGITNGNWNFNTDSLQVQIVSTGGNPFSAMLGLRLVLDSGFFVSQGAIHDITVQNLTIQNAGASNMFKVLGNNFTVRDCVFSWIGGANIGGGSGVGSRAGDGFNEENTYSTQLIERNYFYELFDNAVAPQLFTNGVHDQMTIRNNIAFHWDKFVELETGAGTMTGVYIYNNTAYGVNSWSDNQRPNNTFGTWGFEVIPGSTLSTLDVRNNVYAGVLTFGILLHSPLLFDFTDWAVLRTVNYNLWKAVSGNVKIAAADASCLSASNPNMATWAADCGFETNGLIDVNPSFTSSANDFTPTLGSPLRNAGANLYNTSNTVPPNAPQGVVWDFFRLPRPTSGAFTIGAIQ